MELNTLSSGYIQSQRTEYSENTGALLVSLDLLNPFGWTKRTSPNKEHAFATAFQQTNLEISDASGPTLQNTSDPGSAGSSKHQTVHMGPLVHHPLFINIPQLDLKTLQIFATGQAHSSRALTLKLCWFPSCCAIKPCLTSIL
jgi:hypothetical protein